MKTAILSLLPCVFLLAACQQPAEHAVQLGNPGLTRMLERQEFSRYRPAVERKLAELDRRQPGEESRDRALTWRQELLRQEIHERIGREHEVCFRAGQEVAQAAGGARRRGPSNRRSATPPRAGARSGCGDPRPA